MGREHLVEENQDLGVLEPKRAEAEPEGAKADKVVPEGAVYGEPPHDSTGDVVE